MVSILWVGAGFIFDTYSQFLISQQLFFSYYLYLDLFSGAYINKLLFQLSTVIENIPV